MKAWKKRTWVLISLLCIALFTAAESAWGLMDFWLTASQKETVIVIDAGHGGIDPGAVEELTVEKDLNLAIAKKLQVYLEEAGYTVYMTRIEDTGLYEEDDTNKKRSDMQERVSIITDSKADLMISIHQNAYPDSRYYGPQVFFQKNNAEAATLALLVQEQMNSFTLPGNTRQAKPNESYFILKNSPMPAILVECGFITNSNEAEKLHDESYQKKVAWGIYSGIEAYLRASSN